MKFRLKLGLIFSGGDVSGMEYIPQGYSVAISADGGYINALKLGVLPNVCMGDFDTLKTTIDPHCEVVKLPPEKDDTDTMVCIKRAISMGCDTIYIYGALGGRFDHAMANVQTLEYMHTHGVDGYLVDVQNVITMQGVGTKTYQHRGDFKYFSILSMAESSVVSGKGLKYPLENTHLIRSFPLGVSNEILEEVATLTVHSGLVLVMYSRDKA